MVVPSGQVTVRLSISAGLEPITFAPKTSDNGSPGRSSLVTTAQAKEGAGGVGTCAKLRDPKQSKVIQMAKSAATKAIHRALEVLLLPYPNTKDFFLP